MVIPEPSYEVIDGKRQSAREVYEKRRKKKSEKDDKKGTAGKATSARTSDVRSKNPISLLKQMAERFGVKNLSKR